MEELRELKGRLENERPAAWDALPDIGLYMDQLISYMPRQLIHYEEDERLTSAMVNNYIKDGALPRAVGKRYSREHLAYLTAICALKQVLSVKDAARLLSAAAEGEKPEELYALFEQELDRALDVTAGCLDSEAGEDELPRLALALALRSYANQLACRRVLDIMTQKAQPVGKPEKSKKSEKKKTAGTDK